MAGNGSVSFTPPRRGVRRRCGDLIWRWSEAVQNTARRPKCNFGRHRPYPATATPLPKPLIGPGRLPAAGGVWGAAMMAGNRGSMFSPLPAASYPMFSRLRDGFWVKNRDLPLRAGKPPPPLLWDGRCRRGLWGRRAGTGRPAWYRTPLPEPARGR